MDIDLITDSGSTTTQVVDALGTIAAGDLTQRYQVDKDGDMLPAFDNLFLDVTWKTGTDETDAPAIDKIEVFYELIDI